MHTHIYTHSQDVADLKTQFPTLAEDIKLPLFCEPEQYFSSVFRIGSPDVQLWTHYDVSILAMGHLNCIAALLTKAAV